MITLKDLDTTARTLYGEARGEGWQGLVAVAWVVRNRACDPKWWGGPGWHSVCRKRRQFSCWNADGPGRPALEKLHPAENLHFRDSMAAALAVALDLEPDPTGGATHYHADTIDMPDWARDMIRTRQIGHHIFYRETENPAPLG